MFICAHEKTLIKMAYFNKTFNEKGAMQMMIIKATAARVGLLVTNTFTKLVSWDMMVMVIINSGYINCCTKVIVLGGTLKE